MATRTRTQDDRTQHTGWYVKLGNQTFRTCYTGRRSSCSDVVGSRDQANPLNLLHRYEDHWILRGSPPGEPEEGYFECPSTWSAYATRSPELYWGGFNQADAQSYWNHIVGATNPQTPEVNIPLFVGELKDVPRLLHSWGKGLLKRLGNGHLTYQFGIRPLVADLQKLFAFQAAVQERLNWLARAAAGKSIGKRCYLDSASDDLGKTGSYTVESAYANIKADRYTTARMQMWGSARWVPSADAVRHLRGASVLNEARRLTFGLNTAGAVATVWNLIPWSWLIDWFASVNAMLNATNNSIGLYPEDVCLMRMTELVDVFRPTQVTPWVTVGGLERRRAVRKVRFVLSEPSVPTPAFLPLIEGRQLSILAALAVTRR